MNVKVREVLSMAVGPSEAEQFWAHFPRSLTRRGLRGVERVISDVHEGLKAAAAEALKATWPRCCVHFKRNALAHAPKGQRQTVAALIRTVFAQEAKADARRQCAPWPVSCARSSPGWPS
jgi:putative transposase